MPDEIKKEPEKIDDDLLGISPKTVRTFRSDALETARTKGQSLAQMAISEQARQRRTEIIEKKKRFSNACLVGSALVLFIAGSIFTLFVFFREPREGAPMLLPTEKELIFTDEQKKITLTRITSGEFERAVERESATTAMPTNDIKSIYFVQELPPPSGVGKKVEAFLTAQEIIGVHGSSVPPTLLRSFEGSLLLGLHSFVENKPFLIIKIGSYENALAGMRAWEKTMVGDLAHVLLLQDEKEAVAKESFRDAIIKNLDTRIIEDENKNLVLLYSFVRRDTLVIATNKTTFDEITERLFVSGDIQQ